MVYKCAKTQINGLNYIEPLIICWSFCEKADNQKENPVEGFQ